MINKNVSINGMILAAGFGTRLQPVIGEIPKPLAKLKSTTSIIDSVVENLVVNNIIEITVNLHHKKDLIRNHLLSKYENVNFHFVVEDEILGTGGGIFNCKSYLEKSDYTLISNSDILHRFDLKKYIEKHIESEALVSLLVFENKDLRGFRYNENSELTGYSGEKVKKSDKVGTFTGVHIVSKEFFQLNHFKDQKRFFSIIDIYSKMILNKQKINVIQVDGMYWNDIGTKESFEQGKIDYDSLNYVREKFNEKIKSWEVVFKGASDKRVFRIELNNNNSFISISSPLSEEINSIKEFSNFLSGYQYPVPKVLFNKENWLLAEDGGEFSLLDTIKVKPNLKEKFYKQSIDAIKLLSGIDVEKFPTEHCYQTDEFDFENIEFDLKYFNKWYLENRLTDIDINKLSKSMYSEISKEPIVIMHRDFQSTNILIKNKLEIRIIDIQTMRKGYALYDLASLLFDSYVPFDKQFIEKMIDYYYDGEIQNLKGFYNTVLIRLLQNIGAFSRFSEKKFFKDKLIPCKFRLNWLFKEKKDYLSKVSVDLLSNLF